MNFPYVCPGPHRLTISATGHNQTVTKTQNVTSTGSATGKPVVVTFSGPASVACTGTKTVVVSFEYETKNATTVDPEIDGQAVGAQAGYDPHSGTMSSPVHLSRTAHADDRRRRRQRVGDQIGDGHVDRRRDGRQAADPQQYGRRGAAAASSHNIEFTFTADSDQITVYGDSGRLQQIFANLLSNALNSRLTAGAYSIDLRTTRIMPS